MSHAATYRSVQICLLGLLAMLAFAANSLLCRLALKGSHIDAASFTSIRILSGAFVLWLLVWFRNRQGLLEGSWLGASALFTYAAGFSFAYITLPAGAGALILFGAVQITMIGYGIWTGERLSLRQASGVVLALTGLVVLLLPGLSAPHPGGAALMLVAGVAWGVYSLLGKSARNPMEMTSGNFVRCVPLAIILSAATIPRSHLDIHGSMFAFMSGAIASGIGYAIWYQVVSHIKSTNAAIMQLSVPVLATLGGNILLMEPISLRMWLASIAILGGITLVLINNRYARRST